MDDQFTPFAAKMRRDHVPQVVIDLFQHYYTQLRAGETGLIANQQALPVNELPDYATLDTRFIDYGHAALEKTVVIKLNGGLGTTMGLHGPKSLLPAKDGLSFLDIMLAQVMHLRQAHQVRIPLLLMNSFTTQEDTLQAIANHPEFQQRIPISFVQNRIPKIWKADLRPAEWPDDPSKEWCPPGHGDLYTAIDTSEILDQLLEAGFEYAFVSNSDNLGATLDCKILGYLALHQVPFLMEVALRSPADRKGGHLAQRPDGQLILRELAQCPPEEVSEFQDIERYRFFNTNNLWINLRTLRRVLDERRGVLGLPLIRNEKPIDATQPDSPRIYQLETAMGSAISVFAGAQALCVPRSRFAPVKKCSDLLLLWSDVYQLTEDYHLVQSPLRKGNPPNVVLDDQHYGLIEEMKKRFPQGAPSLIDCSELRIDGDVRFGRNVVMKGKVQILHRSDRPYLVPDGTVFQGPEGGT